MADLPPLPDDVVDELIDLDPEEFSRTPETDPDALTIRSVDVLRSWLRDLRRGEGLIKVTTLANDVIDQSVESLVADHRRFGIDLTDRRDLLVTVFAWQTAMVGLMQDLEGCDANGYELVHSYIHVVRPIVNIAISFELLILAAFGDEAALPTEGGD